MGADFDIFNIIQIIALLSSLNFERIHNKLPDYSRKICYGFLRFVSRLKLLEEGVYNIYASSGARTEIRLLALHGQPGAHRGGLHLNPKLP